MAYYYTLKTHYTNETISGDPGDVLGVGAYMRDTVDDHAITTDPEVADTVVNVTIKNYVGATGIIADQFYVSGDGYLIGGNIGSLSVSYTTAGLGASGVTCGEIGVYEGASAQSITAESAYVYGGSLVNFTGGSLNVYKGTNGGIARVSGVNAYYGAYFTDSIADTVECGYCSIIGGTVSNLTADELCIEGGTAFGCIVKDSLTMLDRSVIRNGVQVQDSPYVADITCSRASISGGTVGSLTITTDVLNWEFDPDAYGRIVSVLDISLDARANSVSVGNIQNLQAIRRGTITFTYSCYARTRGELSNISFSSDFGIKGKDNRKLLTETEEEDRFSYDEYNDLWTYYVDFTYNSGNFKYGSKTVRTDKEGKCEIKLNGSELGGASQNVTVDNLTNGVGVGMNGTNVLNISTPVESGGTGKVVISAGKSSGAVNTYELNLIVVPEVISGLDKGITEAIEQVMRASQKETFTARIPDISTKLVGVAFSFKDMAISVTVSDANFTFKVQGAVEWELGKGGAGTGKNNKLSFNIAGDNYFSITTDTRFSNATAAFVGEIKIPDFNIGGFAFSNMKMKADTTVSGFTGSCYLKLPCISYSFGGEISLLDGVLDSVIIGVDNLNVPIASTGIFLQGITGGVRNMAEEGGKPITLSGSMRMTYGPEINLELLEWCSDWIGIDAGKYSLIEMTSAGDISYDDFTGSCSMTILGGMMSGSGTIYTDYSSKTSISGHFSALNGIVTVTGTAVLAGDTITVKGTGGLHIPNKWYFGTLCGTTLSGNCVISVNGNSRTDDDFAAVWTEGDLFGQKYNYGIQFFFDGSFNLLSAELLEKFDRMTVSASKSVDSAGTGNDGLLQSQTLADSVPNESSSQFTLEGGITLFSASWTEGQNVSVTLTDDSGTDYTWADIGAGLYADIQVASNFGGENGVALAVRGGTGVWTMTVSGSTDALISASILANTAIPVPAITSVTRGNDGRSVRLLYNVGNTSGFTNFRLAVYCAESDGKEGALVAELTGSDITGEWLWSLPDTFRGGDSVFYLIASADGMAQKISDCSSVCSFDLADISAPAAVGNIEYESGINGSALSWRRPKDDIGVSGYVLRYAVSGREEYTVINGIAAEDYLFSPAANGTYDVSVAALDAAGHQGEWSPVTAVEVFSHPRYQSETLSRDLELNAGQSAYAVELSYGCITVKNGAYLDTASGFYWCEVYGTAVNLTTDDATELVYGVSRNSVLLSGSTQMLYSGGIAESCAVGSGAQQIVQGNASAFGSDVSGILFAASGSTVGNVVIGDGGSLELCIGSKIDGCVLKSGAQAAVTLNNDYGNSAAIGAIVVGKMLLDGGTLSMNVELECEESGCICIRVAGYDPGCTSIISGCEYLNETVILEVSAQDAVGTYTLCSASEEELLPRVSVDCGDGAMVALDLGTTFNCGLVGRKYTIGSAEDFNGSYLTLTVEDFGDDSYAKASSAQWEGDSATVKFVQGGTGSQLDVQVNGSGVNFYRSETGSTWSAENGSGQVIASGSAGDDVDAPVEVRAIADDVSDVFFARISGQWGRGFRAQNVGYGSWHGTGDLVDLYGKNRITDIFSGSSDANILLLSDDTCGDVLFVDDIYSESSGNAATGKSRLSGIDEIRGGAGDDLIDLTSDKFAAPESLTVRGGSGDDVLWAAAGDNRLFGDAGNDRIVGAAGDDLIVGGSGNDHLYGGGGCDTFTFGGNWGQDMVYQEDSGSVILWFESGNRRNWDEATRTYSDGANSVTVDGTCEVTLKFGDDGSELYSHIVSVGGFLEQSSAGITDGVGIAVKL